MGPSAGPVVPHLSLPPQVTASPRVEQGHNKKELWGTGDREGVGGGQWRGPWRGKGPTATALAPCKTQLWARSCHVNSQLPGFWR